MLRGNWNGPKYCFGLSLSASVKLFFLSEKFLKRTIKANRWMRRIDLWLPNPTQVDNCKYVTLVSMAAQNMIFVETICENLYRSADKQMTCVQLELQLREQDLRFRVCAVI